MAQELREGDGKSGIARAGKRKWGYDPAQVDAFLERAHALYDSEGMNLTQHDIQNVSFDLRKNGYVIAQVDAALGRLERAVVDKQTTWEIAQHGRVTWKAKTEKLYHEVQNHAERNERERFKSGAPKQPSYDKKQVDRLVDQIVDKAAAALGVDDAPISLIGIIVPISLLAYITETRIVSSRKAASTWAAVTLPNSSTGR